VVRRNGGAIGAARMITFGSSTALGAGAWPEVSNQRNA
jgi:hypothetical protein